MIFNSFNFPQIFIHAKGEKFSGEIVFLAGLFRLHYPNTFYDYTWSNFFGLSPQNACKCFQLFFTFVKRYWAYLIFDHLDFWKPYLHHFSRKIRLKANSLGANFPVGFNIFAFIDSKYIFTARPGGPTCTGKNAERRDQLLQEACYSGYKKAHRIKVQSVMLPNGMDFHLFGPLVARKNDIYLFTESNINERIKNLQRDIHEDEHYRIYGDAGYEFIRETHLKTRHHHHPDFPLTPLESQENHIMSKCRESIEWSYKETVTLFAFCDFKKNLKLYLSPVPDIFLVCTILRNAYCCLNGSEAASFFGCPPPELREWMSHGPVEL